MRHLPRAHAAPRATISFIRPLITCAICSCGCVCSRQAAAGREFSPHLIHRCAGRNGAPLDARRDFDPRVFLFVHGRSSRKNARFPIGKTNARMLTLIALTTFGVQSPAMPEMQPPPALPKSQPFMRRNSTVIKLFGVGCADPRDADSTGHDPRRAERSAGAPERSGERDHRFVGQGRRTSSARCLGVPFQYKFKSMKDTTMPDGHVERREVEEMLVGKRIFLPESLKIVSDAQTQTLHRGIYDAAVFRAQIKLTGQICAARFRRAQDRLERCAVERRLRHNRGE